MPDDPPVGLPISPQGNGKESGKDQAGSGETVDKMARARRASSGVNSRLFIRDLRRLRALRTFLIEQHVPYGSVEGHCLSFGELNLLKYKWGGREPDPEEWYAVDYHFQTLFPALTDKRQRERFLLGGIPWWASILPFACALIAVFSLLLAFIAPSLFPNWAAIIILCSYLAWIMALGAVGAVAFISMNFLSVQEDVTFDILNTRLMFLRITLGALFGLVLTLPFGFQHFVNFTKSVAGTGGLPTLQEPGESGLTKQAIMLLLPFVLGFSTPLVMLVMNRLVDAIQGFFGRPAPPPPPPPPSKMPLT